MQDYVKFLAQPQEKQQRIINASMREFQSGYKNASTDNIVRDAGISKGILFHYFGTKERLYNFLIDYSISVMREEYIDLVSRLQPDILESIWQLSLLKRDVSNKHPAIFDFVTNAFVDNTHKHESSFATLEKFNTEQSNMLAQVYARADVSLFRDDVCAKTVMDIISWTLTGFGQSKMNIAPAGNLGASAREHYDEFLQEFQEILDTLRKCFYK